MAEDDPDTLREQVAEQRALTQAQQKQLDVQAQTLDRLSQRLDAAPPVDGFESTTYGAVNLMWSPQPNLTLGIEYAYGQSERDDGSDLDNHRVAVGMQVY